MKIKRLSTVLLASTLLYFTNPTLPLSIQNNTVCAETSKEEIDVDKVLKERRERLLKNLENILKEEYDLKLDIKKRVDRLDRDENIDEDIAYLKPGFNVQEGELSGVINILQDKEFKKFYKYASESYPYKWRKRLFKIVDLYHELDGFESLE